MLEDKSGSSMANSNDIIQLGEKILLKLDGVKTISVEQVEDLVSQMNISFD
jgi:hypothetical protein